MFSSRLSILVAIIESLSIVDDVIIEFFYTKLSVPPGAPLPSWFLFYYSLLFAPNIFKIEDPIKLLNYDRFSIYFACELAGEVLFI